MHYAVTGGAGNLGYHVISQLLTAEHRVTLIDREWPHGAVDRMQVRIVLADLTDETQALRALEGAEGVIHAGAIPCPRFPLDGQAHRNNHLSTYNVLEAACRLGIRRVVNVSSLQACGLFVCAGAVSPAFLPIDETQEVLPANAYGLAKRFGEMIADLCVMHTPGLSVASVRLPRLFGSQQLQHFARLYDQAAESTARWFLDDYWCFMFHEEAAETCLRLLDADFTGHAVIYAHSGGPYCRLGWGELRRRHFAGVAWRGGVEDEALVSRRRLHQLTGWLPQRQGRELIMEAQGV